MQDTFRQLNDHFGNQDLGFQLAGLDRADSLRNADRGLGMGLIGQGTQQGLGQQDQLLQGYQGLSNVGLQGAQIAGGLQNQDFMQILSQLGAGQGVNNDMFNQLMSLLSGSTATSAARSGANAGAGQISAQNNPMGNLWNFAGSALGGWASGGFGTGGTK
jgi:hypothetical protein